MTRNLLATVVIASMFGCGGNERKIVEPPMPQSSTVNLTFVVDAEDAAAAQTLGWSAGIPNVEVTFQRADSSATPRTFVSDASGKISISDVADNDYEVSARRLLSASDLTKLAGSSDAIGFLTDTVVRVTSTGRTLTIRPHASRRRGLIISEWSFHGKFTPGAGTYSSGGFLELYNNADTTVYLDGLLLLDALNLQFENPPNSTCASISPWTNDASGVWARTLASFPGSGKQFPVTAGTTAVIATDAINHSAFSSDLVNLTGANFEFIGPADVDNPAVPNMVDMSNRSAQSTHGINFGSSLGGATVLVSRMDVALATRSLLPDGTEWLKFPREKILDVMIWRSAFVLDPSRGLTPCPALVNAVFDRGFGFISDAKSDVYTRSITRKTFTSLGNRIVLQHTRSSSNDFKSKSRSPGSLQ